jgi:hypothetical protein
LLRSPLRLRSGSGFVHFLGELIGGLLQSFSLFLDLLDRTTGHGILQIGNRRFDSALLLSGNLVTVILEGLLGGIDQTVGLVAHLDLLPFLPVFLSMHLGFLHHLVDILVCKTRGGFDTDLLFLAGAKIFGADMDYTVRINIESHLDLRNTARSWRNTDKVEFSKGAVLAGHLPFALEHMDRYRGLAVGCRGEDLALAGRNSSIPFDKLGGDST